MNRVKAGLILLALYSTQTFAIINDIDKLRRYREDGLYDVDRVREPKEPATTQSSSTTPATTTTTPAPAPAPTETKSNPAPTPVTPAPTPEPVKTQSAPKTEPTSSSSSSTQQSSSSNETAAGGSKNSDDSKPSDSTKVDDKLDIKCEYSILGTLPNGSIEEGVKSVLFKCRSNISGPTTVSSNFNFNDVQVCSSSLSSEGFCLKESMNSRDPKVDGEALKYIGAYVVLKAKGLGKVEVPANAFTLNVSAGAKSFSFRNQPFVLQDQAVAPKCSIVVSGAEKGVINPDAQCSGPGCRPEDVQMVENGQLIFKVNSSSGEAFSKVSWDGGPDANGIWDAPTPDKNLLVKAKATLGSSMAPVECAINIRQHGPAFNIKIDKYGNCPLYRDIRNYYYLNKNNTEVQTSGYGKPLRILGVDVDYAKNTPDVPFSGIRNGAASIDGAVYKNSDDQVVIPPIEVREYSSAVIVIRKYTKSGTSYSIEDPAYYGLLNFSDYSSTKLKSIDAKKEIGDDDLVVVQLFLAHKQMNSQGKDIRGSLKGIPWHQFTASNGGEPFDRLVPMAEDSCLDLFQIKPPKRPDGKALPRSIKDSKMCVFSRPFTFAEVRAGRAAVKAVDTMPQFANDLYPMDLIPAATGAPVSEEHTSTASCDPNSTDLVDCWNISAADMAATSKPTWTSGKAVSKVQPAETKVVLEQVPGDECSTRVKTSVENQKITSGTSMGVRYSTKAMYFGATFACAVNFDMANKPVVAEIYLNGSEKKGWAPAPATASCSKTFQSLRCCPTARTGLGYNVTDEHTYTKSKAPRSCVKTTNFRVQPFGYEGGFTVAEFKAPLCPGSQYAYDNVALSWSPLILDVTGNGIQISRKFDDSVSFDIHGTGKMSRVDWPMNVHEVAFLVLPKKNKVTSIKELFGEHGGAQNGFEALAKYDDDKNRLIDSRDKKFKDLRLWFDKNRNGVSDPGEIVKLKDHGVESIYVSYTKPAVGNSAERKTLNSVYFNNQKGNFLNVEDHYFYEYVKGKRAASKK